MRQNLLPLLEIFRNRMCITDIDFQPDQIELNPLNASLVHYNVSPVVNGRRSKGQLKRKLAVKSKELMKKMKIDCDDQSSEEKKNSDSTKDLMKKVKEKTKYEVNWINPI